MELKKVNINGAEFEFVNTSGNTRSGFYHESKLFRNNCLISSNKCFYLNRTWESYRYQTCMKGLVYSLIADREKTLLNKFKELNEYKKLTQKRKEDFYMWDEFVNDTMLADYKALYGAL